MQHAMKTYVRSGGIALTFMTSALGGAEWSALRPVRFTPKEGDPGGHWIEGWVVPSVGLEAVEERKIFFPCWESNPGQPAAIPTEQS
jgi:hypothetical protein